LAKRELGQVEEAELDFSECVKWVDLNGESKWMYERYKSKMPELEFHFQKLSLLQVFKLWSQYAKILNLSPHNWSVT
tara:strand:- start:1514 stop:1744 length:231 start_codon:yes stop_codon:yes gene_type:complete